MPEKKTYKNICFSEISNDILVFHLAESKFQEEELLIIGLSQFIELVGYKRPVYIIIDKKDVKIRTLDSLKEYLKHQGIDELMNLAVKKILFVVSEERIKELNSKVGYRGIEACTDYSSCLEIIKKHKRSLKSALKSM